VSLIEAVRRANRPGPPEDSVRLRVVVTGAAAIGILACRAQGEVPTAMAGAALVLLVAGMLFSHATRRDPIGIVKPFLAAAAIAIFGWFFLELRAHAFTDIGGVEGLLAGLFVWIQVTHAFDVPARRDLSFSVAGSAGLMAVAGAQATDMTFGLYFVAWGACCLAALLAFWRSAGGGPDRRQGVPAVAAVLAVGVGALLLLPAPRVAGNIGFPSDVGDAVGVTHPESPSGDGPAPAEPARAGSPAGAARVGGYLGFANRLDTALRGNLSDAVVMRVRAQRPTFWLGETFTTWDGRSWRADPLVPEGIDTGSPFFLPVPEGASGRGEPDLQTFYVVTPNPNLVFHAATAREVWFPSSSLQLRPDGTILSPIALGRGTIYTVQSAVPVATPDDLRSVSSASGALDPAQGRAALALPQAYPRVTALAEAVTAGAPTTYDKVEALVAWIGAHTRYSTDIPPVPAGSDTVDDFLFGHRVGFCEQISTALTVMARSIGIPAREAVGYVPGPYNPVTDLYEVRAKDAHAWVQVWFPGYGWQSFDPTAVVPLANPSPGATLLGTAGRGLARWWLPLVLAAFGVVAAVLGTRAWRRRPRTWVDRVLRDMERAGRRAGARRAPGDTVREHASALERHGLAGWGALATLVEEEAYGDRPASPGTRDEAIRRARQLSRTPA
jgi:transglutaminase-like putative cysteine protease